MTALMSRLGFEVRAVQVTAYQVVRTYRDERTNQLVRRVIGTCLAENKAEAAIRRAVERASERRKKAEKKRAVVARLKEGVQRRKEARNGSVLGTERVGNGAAAHVGRPGAGAGDKGEARKDQAQHCCSLFGEDSAGGVGGNE